MKSAGTVIRALVVLSALSAASCRIAGVTEHPRDWLVKRMGAEPDTLNPIIATDASEATINSDIYETLIERDMDTLEMKPKLASTWEISADRMTYTFHVRQGVKFHNGEPLTAKNFKYAYDKIMDPKVNSPSLRNYYQDIKSVEVLDDYTIRFTYGKAYFLGFEICGGLQALPMEEFSKTEDFNKSPVGRHPIGTGPYKFVEWITGQKVVLERNEDYWGKKPEIKRIVYRLIIEPSPALIELKKRRIDFMGLTPLQWVKQTESDRFNEGFRKEKYYEPYFNYIGWNSKRPYFADKKVRRAMTMMVNREEMLDTLLYGLGVVVSGTAYVNSPYYDDTIEPWPYDPDGARKLLDEAGWIDHDGDGIRDKDGVPFRFEFLIKNGSDFASQLATVLQEEMKKSGIDMQIRQLEWATFIKFIDDRKFDAMVLGWSLGVETDPYQLWHSSQAEEGSNFTNFKNAEADAIIEEVRRTFDRDKRIALLKRFHAIVHEEQPYTFLYCTPALSAINRRFGNVVVHKLGLEPREWTIPAKIQ